MLLTSITQVLGVPPFASYPHGTTQGTGWLQGEAGGRGKEGAVDTAVRPLYLVPIKPS